MEQVRNKLRINVRKGKIWLNIRKKFIDTIGWTVPSWRGNEAILSFQIWNRRLVFLCLKHCDW
jgi:hypothetical protein